MTELRHQISSAVRDFWTSRDAQAKKQGGGGDADRGARSAVTGGRQMSGFERLVSALLMDAGCPADAIHYQKRLELPGWFRAEKKWDLIVVRERELVAAVEFKSQVGPSFGNNFNNRTEEALGSATDLLAAYREGAFEPSPRPWLGYMMLLEDCEKSDTPVNVEEPHFKVFPEFRGASYRGRYEQLLTKLLRDRLYDGAAFLISPAIAGLRGAFVEPSEELRFEMMMRSLAGHVSARFK